MDDLDSGLIWAGLLGSLQADLEALTADLSRLKDERLRLEKMSMYPCQPTESWEFRDGGETKYLRMVFGRERPAGWPRKVYIGCKLEAVMEARRLAANRRRWEDLDRKVAELERFLVTMRANLSQAADRLARYRVPDLGTVGADDVAGGVPKEEDE